MVLLKVLIKLMFHLTNYIPMHMQPSTVGECNNLNSILIFAELQLTLTVEYDGSLKEQHKCIPK